MTAPLNTMTTQEHLDEAIVLLQRAHELHHMPYNNHEKVMAKTALAQAHLTMVSLGVDRGHLPATVEPRRSQPTGER